MSVKYICDGCKCEESGMLNGSKPAHWWIRNGPMAFKSTETPVEYHACSSSCCDVVDDMIEEHKRLKED